MIIHVVESTSCNVLLHKHAPKSLNRLDCGAMPKPAYSKCGQKRLTARPGLVRASPVSREVPNRMIHIQQLQLI
ncbi:MAG: hypothetical protein HOP03_04415 [Lysobacter sp.]|nr:hypothetical protein [Lysobacter sp.]